MARTSIPGADSDRGRIYLAALDADVPVSPLYLSAQAGVKMSSMGSHIQRLLVSGLLREFGTMFVPKMEKHEYARTHRLYVASTSPAVCNEMSHYAPEMFRDLINSASDLPDSGEKRFLVAILHRAAHDSLSDNDLRYFRPGSGIEFLCDVLGLDADWVCEKWIKTYTTVVDDARTAA